MREWKGPVIDAHAHVVERLAGFGIDGEMRYIGGGRVRWATGREVTLITAGTDCYTDDMLLELMDENGIDKAVLLQGPFLGMCNDYVHECQERRRGRLFGMGCVDPFCGSAETLVKKFIEVYGFKGIKFEMSRDFGFMGYHPEFRVDGELMEPLLVYLEREGSRISVDMTGLDRISMQSEGLVNVAKRHPGLKIVLEHAFNPAPQQMDMFRREIGRLAVCENVSFGIAALPARSSIGMPYPMAPSREVVRVLKDIVGYRRILWGTDTPTVLRLNSYSELKNYIAEEGLFTDEALAAVYYGNAAEFYGI